MGDYDFDLSALGCSPAFKRLSSQRVGSSSSDSSDKRSSKGCSTGSIFNQVKVSQGSPGGGPISDPRLARLKGAIDDNATSAFTLNSLAEVSREVQQANIIASTASVNEVEAAVRLGEELRKRSVDSDNSAIDERAEMLSLVSVERLLRS
jgi:hypothetical protein